MRSRGDNPLSHAPVILSGKVRKDRTGQWGLFDVGTRQENRKYTQTLLVLLDKLIKQLAAAPPGFISSLGTQEVDACVASFQQEGEKNGYDGAVDGFLACLDDYQDKLRRELTELSEKLVITYHASLDLIFD